MHVLTDSSCTNVLSITNSNELNLVGNTLGTVDCAIESDGRFSSVSVQGHLPRWTSSQSGSSHTMSTGAESTLSFTYETEGSTIAMTCCAATEATS